MNGKTKITRRHFLALTGGVVGAAALACCGLTGLAAQKPAAEMIESSCGEEDGMGDKVLVAYASRCGSTGEVAEAISRGLCAEGMAVDVRQMKDVSDLSAYRGVTAGSAVYRANLLPEAVEFVKVNQEVLGRIPVAYFCLRDAPRRHAGEARKDRGISGSPAQNGATGKRGTLCWENRL